MIARLRHFAGNESGATAIEYGVMVCLVSIAIVAGLTATGTHLSAKFSSVGAAFGDDAAPVAVARPVARPITGRAVPVAVAVDSSSR